jgi:steroid 5-alpha reductase family enzyme
MKQFIIYLFIALCAHFGIMIFFAGGVSALLPWLHTADPLFVVLLCALSFSVCSFLAGIITKDYSWVDRMWSVQPVLYGFFYAWRGECSPVIMVASGLIAVWGIRLTWNFASKGGYTGMEDYRWAILRNKINNPILWQIFNLCFISFFQNALFAGFTLPMYYMIQYDVSINLFFIIAAILCALSIVLETLADREQNNFQKAKQAAWEGKAYPSKYEAEIKQGFISSGLFSKCRHPNYVGEMGTWWSLWLMAFALIGGNPFKSGIIGALVLTLLFIGSSTMSEGISNGKYPTYQDYQKKVYRFIPWFARKQK